MQQKGIAVVGVVIGLVVGLLVVAGGYFFLFNERAQLERAVRPDTSTEESVRDKLVPRKEIVESGLNIEVVIEPSDNNVISDTVKITATQVAEEAAGVGFFLSPDRESFIEGGQPSLGIDSSETGGWTNTFNTTEYDNGEYYINVIVYPEGGEGNPLGIAQIPVEIKN